MSSDTARVRDRDRAGQRRHHRDVDAGHARAPRALRGCASVDGFRAGPAGGGRSPSSWGCWWGRRTFPSAEVVGALARRLSGAGRPAALARHRGRRRAAAARAGRLRRRAARWRWRARRCRGCFATRSPSPACSASRRARRWARCWRSTSTSRGARSGCCRPARSLGAAVDALLVFAIAARRGRGRVFTATLLLVGVAVDVAQRVADDVRAVDVAGAATTSGAQVMYWLLGGLEGRTWDHLLLGGAGDPGRHGRRSPAHARELDALLLGEVGAQSVGVDVPRVRLRAGARERAGGRARRSRSPGRSGSSGCWCRTCCGWRSARRTRALVPLSFFGGGVFLVIADVVARTLSRARSRSAS